MLTSTKARRERLLKQRPLLRPFDPQNLRDLGLIWADYKAGNFYLPPGLTNEQFLEALAKILLLWDSVWFIEDDSMQYASGRGPVSLVGINTDGWKVEPHVHHFAWASPKRKLRAWVALLHRLRNNKEVGLIFVVALEKDKPFFDHLVNQYGVIHPKGRLLNGVPTGVGFMYAIKGRKPCLGQQSSQQPSALLEH